MTEKIQDKQRPIEIKGDTKIVGILFSVEKDGQELFVEIIDKLRKINPYLANTHLRKENNRFIIVFEIYSNINNLESRTLNDLKEVEFNQRRENEGIIRFVDSRVDKLEDKIYKNFDIKQKQSKNY